MLTVISGGVCPKCGCKDIKNKMYHYECFKCGYIEKRTKPMLNEFRWVELKGDKK